MNPAHPKRHRPPAPARPDGVPRMTPRSAAILATFTLALALTASSAAAAPREDDPAPDKTHSTAARAREHWAFQPVRQVLPPAAPDTPHPIDRFIRAMLREKGLSPQPPAPPRERIRRLYFDLIGLPPSPEAVEAFTRDPSDAHYARVVDDLLALPQFGERWARHWLDLARYTESSGFEYDRLRDHAWHYRDYVIRSFNEDKPYDRFMREQIAGDVIEPVTHDGIIGASLLVCGAYDQAGNSQANVVQRTFTREEELEDLISVVGQTFLGLTLNCSRCHDHKFDPIPITDYYRIKSVFDGVLHGDRPLETPDETRRRETRTAALQTEIAEAEAEEARCLATIRPCQDSIPTDAEVLTGMNPVTRATYDAARKRAQEARERLEALRQPGPQAYAGRRTQPPPTQLFQRGNVRSPDGVVAPGALSALAEPDHEFGLAPDAPEADRRIRFAEWLAHPRNPLPARVIANRLWHYHFGQGIVTTPSDFGAAGARPTHPELLDWLATYLVDHGWSLKALHRLIVTSATYQQASNHDPAAASLDADNLLLWRFQPRRLEAETLRDAMLAVSGCLNPAVGGPSFRPFTTSEYGATFYHLVDRDEPAHNRRTIYRMNVNSGKDPLLDAFDCPDPSTKIPRRATTTTPLQALGLMNGSFTLRQARLLAERASTLPGSDLPARVRRAYEIALGRPPTPDEARIAIDTAAEHGLPSVAWVLLNSTEFLHVR